MNENQPRGSDFDFDFAILGGGSAGYAAARTAVELGLKTAVIDGAEELGGLCILRGCMPSKTLIESANRALSIRRAAEFGLSAQGGPADTRFIRERKRRLIGDFAGYRQRQLENGSFALLRGIGRLGRVREGDLQIAVRSSGNDERIIVVRAALIATGSVIHVPQVPGLAEAGYWTSDTLLDAGEIPESFVVLGGGAIALEMAHFLEGIGRKVTVLQRNTQLLTGVDADLANVVCRSLEKRGIEVHCGTKLLRVESSSDGKVVFFEKEGATGEARGAEILVTLGRRPALDGLGLKEAGLAQDGSGHLIVKGTQQTSDPRIFAAGDACGCGALEVVHIAIQQGETAARNAAAMVRGEPAAQTMDYRCKLFGVFTQPQVAVVGLSETEARLQVHGCLVSSFPFDDHGKSMVMGETEGFVKLIAHPETGMILGGAAAGPEAIELIHEIAMAMHLRATVSQVASAPHYHPTLSEIWTYPAEELANNFKNNS